MASTGQSFIDQFTVNNQGIKDLRELLFLSRLKYGVINETMDLMTGVVNGSRLGGVGEMEPVGTPSNGCNPQWKASNIDTIEKVWELGAYEVPEQICYADLENTIVQWSKRTGTDIADLTGTDYIDVIVEPLLSQALEKMLWRLLWFGDKNALNIDDTGNITDGVNVDLFKVCDGMFKRLFAITAANTAQRVNIAANTAATYASQITQIRADGVATGIFESLLFNAPVKLRQKSDKILLVTQTLADALTIDIKKNRGSDLQWTAVLDGLGNPSTLMTTTVFNGQTIIALPIWDEMIQMFENTGTAWINPHRAVFASKSVLKGGVEGTSEMADLQIWFNRDLQLNRMLVKDKLGTLTWEDNLVMFAY